MVNARLNLLFVALGLFGAAVGFGIITTYMPCATPPAFVQFVNVQSFPEHVVVADSYSGVFQATQNSELQAFSFEASDKELVVINEGLVYILTGEGTYQGSHKKVNIRMKIWDTGAIELVESSASSPTSVANSYVGNVEKSGMIRAKRTTVGDLQTLSLLPTTTR